MCKQEYLIWIVRETIFCTQTDSELEKVEQCDQEFFVQNNIDCCVAFLCADKAFLLTIKTKPKVLNFITFTEIE